MLVVSTLCSVGIILVKMMDKTTMIDSLHLLPCNLHGKTLRKVRIPSS